MEKENQEYNEEDLMAYLVSQELNMEEGVARFMIDDPYGEEYYEDAEEALY